VIILDYMEPKDWKVNVHIIIITYALFTAQAAMIYYAQKPPN
jgi:succinate dehydrogenase hydrophobic anchor subunit